MRLPRMTTRRWMVAAAAVALFSGGMVECARRRERFFGAYRKHALAEIESSIKVRLLTLNVGSAANLVADPPSRSAVASMWKLDAEECRLLEASDEDLQVVMRDAGWKTPKAVPLHINLNQTMSEGRLGRLLRSEDYHRRMRKKYQKAARYPWLPVEPDPPLPN